MKIRLLLKNKHNIKRLYLNNYNKKEILTYKKDFLNFNILGKYETKFNERLIPENYEYYKYDNTFYLNNFSN